MRRASACNPCRLALAVGFEPALHPDVTALGFWKLIPVVSLIEIALFDVHLLSVSHLYALRGGFTIIDNPAPIIAVMAIAVGKPIMPIENIIIRYHRKAKLLRRMTKPKK